MCVNVNVREVRNQGYIGAVDRARVNLGHAEIIRDLSREKWSLRLFHDPVVLPHRQRISSKVIFDLRIARVIAIDHRTS